MLRWTPLPLALLTFCLESADSQQTVQRVTSPLTADTITILKVVARATIDRAVRTADTTTDDAPSRARAGGASAVAMAEQSGDRATQAYVWQRLASMYQRLRLRDSAAMANDRAVLTTRTDVEQARAAGGGINEARARVRAAEVAPSGNRDSSKAQYAQALRLFESASAWSEAADVIRELGYEWDVGRDSSAKVAAREAQLRQRAAAAQSAVDSLMRSGYGAGNDHPIDALRWFRRAADVARSVRDDNTERYALQQEIEVYRRVVDSRASIDDSMLTPSIARDSIETILKKAIRIVQSDARFISTFRRVAEVYQSAGLTDSVIAYRRRALAAYLESHDVPNVANALPPLARAFLDAQQFDSALAYGRLGRRVRAQTDTVPNEDIEVAVARAFEGLGRHDSAAVAYSRAATKAFNRELRLLAAAGQFMEAELADSAAAAYDQLRQIGKSDNDPIAVESGIRGLAQLYQELGQPDRSAEQYQELVRSAERRKDAPQQARGLLMLAQLYHEEGYPDSVRSIVARAMATYPAVTRADRSERLEHCVFIGKVMALLKHEFREEEAREHLPALSRCVAEAR